MTNSATCSNPDRSRSSAKRRRHVYGSIQATRRTVLLLRSESIERRTQNVTCDPQDRSSCSFACLDAASNRRSVKFLDRSAGGRPTLGSDDQSQTPHTTTRMSPLRVVVRSSSDPHSGHRSGAFITRGYAAICGGASTSRPIGRRLDWP